MIGATAPSCLGFAVQCGVMFKGAGVVIAAFLLFIGSVYVLLSAIFGRWMGYALLMTCFSGWLIIMSSLWTFGFWAQGTDTKTNLGPRGPAPTWLVLSAGLTAGSDRFGEFTSFPQKPWATPDVKDEVQLSDSDAAESTAKAYLATEANQRFKLDPYGINAITTTQFTVDSVDFATSENGTKLSVIRAHFTGGGPETTVSMYFDTGNEGAFSRLFLVLSILVFAVHLPLLDRAEKKRRAFLTGGAQPVWFGPA